VPHAVLVGTPNRDRHAPTRLNYTNTGERGRCPPRVATRGPWRATGRHSKRGHRWIVWCGLPRPLVPSSANVCTEGHATAQVGRRPRNGQPGLRLPVARGIPKAREARGHRLRRQQHHRAFGSYDAATSTVARFEPETMSPATWQRDADSTTNGRPLIRGDGSSYMALDNYVVTKYRRMCRVSVRRQALDRLSQNRRSRIPHLCGLSR
jgi:hypothetical protein